MNISRDPAVRPLHILLAALLFLAPASCVAAELAFPAGCDGFDAEQGVIDAAEAHADHQNDRQTQLNRQVGAAAVNAERHAKTTHALDDQQVGLTPGHVATLCDRRKIDLDPGFGGSDMRCNRCLETIRIDDFPGQFDVAGRQNLLDIFVVAGVVGARSDRLEPGRTQALRSGAVQQGAGDEGFADFSVGAGEKVGGAHFRACK